MGCQNHITSKESRKVKEFTKNGKRSHDMNNELFIIIGPKIVRASSPAFVFQTGDN